MRIKSKNISCKCIYLPKCGFFCNFLVKEMCKFYTQVYQALSTGEETRFHPFTGHEGP